MATDDHFPLLCHRCGTQLEPGRGSFYVVRVEAFADPSPPRVSAQDLAGDIDAEIERLGDETRHLSEADLMEQVHRRLTLHLCRTCYVRWIENPTG